MLNAGISGDRLLKDRMGVNALARFERDALSIPGVDTVVVMIGINDIGWPGRRAGPYRPSGIRTRLDYRLPAIDRAGTRAQHACPSGDADAV